MSGRGKSKKQKGATATAKTATATDTGATEPIAKLVAVEIPKDCRGKRLGLTFEKKERGGQDPLSHVFKGSGKFHYAVKHVEPGSIADLAGVEPKDIPVVRGDDTVGESNLGLDKSSVAVAAGTPGGKKNWYRPPPNEQALENRLVDEDGFVKMVRQPPTSQAAAAQQQQQRKVPPRASSKQPHNTSRDPPAAALLRRNHGFA